MAIFYGWVNVLSCFVIGLYVSSIIFFGFTAFFEPLVNEFGWSYTEISFASSLRGLEMGIFAPLAGFLVDRVGSRLVMLLGTMTTGVGLILLSRTQSLAMFYGSFLLIAFGAGGCGAVVLMAVIANWFRKKAGIAFGLMASGYGASGLFVPFIVYLIDHYSWRSALVMLGLGMWALGIPLSLIIRDKPEKYGQIPDGEDGKDSLNLHESQKNEREIKFWDAIKERSFLFLNLVESMRMMTLSAVATHVMPYLSSLGMSRNRAMLVAAGIPLFSIVGRIGFGWAGDAFSKRYMMAMTFCLMGGGMLAFCHLEMKWFILLFLVLFSPGFGGGTVLRGSIVREYFGRNAFGKIIGIVMGSSSIGGIVGPTLAGWTFDKTGSYYLIWLFFCGLMGLAVWITLKSLRGKNIG